MPTATEPIFKTATHARETGRRYRRMADEVAGYPEHEGQHEKVSDLRGRSAHAYSAARALERNQPAPERRSKPQETPWSPRTALRRAGVRATQRADQAARNAPRKAARTVRAAGGVPELGVSRTSVGGLIVYMFVSIVALALLDSMLGGRGPKAIGNTLGFLTGAIERLFSASDPLLSQGVLPVMPATPPNTGTVVPGVNPRTNRGYGVPVNPNAPTVTPGGRPVDPVTGKAPVAG